MSPYLDRFRLDGKTAVVTGAGGAIGLATCHALGEAGATVVVADSVAEAARASLRSLQDAGLKADMTVFDVTRPEEVRQAARDPQPHPWRHRHPCRQRGHRPLRHQWRGCGRRTLDERHRRQTSTASSGAAAISARRCWCGAMAPSSRSARCRASSSTSRSRRPITMPSKAAVHHLTKSLAAEWGPRGVRINSVAPTYIETPMTSGNAAKPEMLDTWLSMTPMNRMGRPSEIASVILFLSPSVGAF